jgi:multidrug efflux pump subunit AcrA (membrane-fusion protein)
MANGSILGAAVKRTEDPRFITGRGRFLADVEADGALWGRATFPNPDHVLLPGMFARARLYGSGEHEAILSPDAAVMADQATKLVMVVNSENVIEPKPVILGPLIDGLRVVRSGLTGSERIVVNGLLRAQPGRKVTTQDTVVERKSE